MFEIRCVGHPVHRRFTVRKKVRRRMMFARSMLRWSTLLRLQRGQQGLTLATFPVQEQQEARARDS
jgi:hypothetical protein